MPPQFHEDVKRLRRCSAMSLLCGVLALMFGGLTVQGLFAGAQSRWLIVFLSGLAACVCGLLGSAKIRKSFSRNGEAYHVPLGNIDLAAILHTFSAEEIAPDTYISFCKVGRLSARLLIQHAPDFSGDDLTRRRKTANRKINQKYRINASAPFFEVASRFRINLVVCDRMSPELQQWVSQDTDKLLSRAESIVSVAVVLDEKLLVFPACTGDVLWQDLQKYEAAARLLCNLARL